MNTGRYIMCNWKRCYFSSFYYSKGRNSNLGGRIKIPWKWKLAHAFKLNENIQQSEDLEPLLNCASFAEKYELLLTSTTGRHSLVSRPFLNIHTVMRYLMPIISFWKMKELIIQFSFLFSFPFSTSSKDQYLVSPCARAQGHSFPL